MIRRKLKVTCAGELVSVTTSGRRALLDCLLCRTGEDGSTPTALYIRFHSDYQARAFAGRVSPARLDGGYPILVQVVDRRAGPEVRLAAGATTLVLQAAKAT